MMDEDSRTIFCGNLSSRCTEEILYEFFLQGGPLERVHIPKDRDGKQKNFGFITYKHAVSVPYALELFEGTTMYNRLLTIKPRQSSSDQNFSIQIPQKMNNPSMNEILQYSNQVLMGYQMPNFGFMPTFIPPGLMPYPSQNRSNSPFVHGKDDRHGNRHHPYPRDRDYNRDRDRERRREHDRHDHRNDNRNDRNHRGHDHHRNSRNHRSNDHRSGRSHR